MGCKVPAPVFWSQMTVYLLLSHYWVYWKIFAVKSGNYNWVLTLNPRGQILRMNAPRKALIAWDFGDKMIALDTPRHPSTLALTSLELARSLPAKLEGGKRVASSDLRVHVPRMGTSSQSSLYNARFTDTHEHLSCFHYKGEIWPFSEPHGMGNYQGGYLCVPFCLLCNSEWLFLWIVLFNAKRGMCKLYNFGGVC